MSKIPESQWSEDEKEFDRLARMMESKRQMDRINGRIDFHVWSRRFTKEQLNAMWERIK